MSDEAMSHDEATSLAETVLQASGHRTEVVPEGVDYYCVNVHKGDCQTFTLYDPADWMWLREQILAP